MIDDLLPEWKRWRREREAAMIAGGVPPSTASEFSLREAVGRARAAVAVGFKAAAEAELIVTEQPDGRTTFHLSLDPSAVPPARREDAQRSLGAVRAKLGT